MTENLFPGIEPGEPRLRRSVAGVAARGPNPASPPYDGMRQYGGYNDTFAFDAVAAACAVNLAPGGVLVWMVAGQIINGGESETSFRQALGCIGLGLTRHRSAGAYESTGH